jgi:hypothetical protein
MKRWLFVLLLLLRTTTGWASVAYVADYKLDSSSVTNAGGLAITITANAGDTLVVNIVSATVAFSVSSVSDNGSGGSSSYSKLVGAANTGIVYQEKWGCLVCKAATTLTVFPAGTSAMNVVIERYTGVSSFGNTNSVIDSPASTTYSPGSITTQDANNYVDCGFGMLSGGTGAHSNEVGTVVEADFAAASGQQHQSTYYNTTASSGVSLTCSFTAGSQFQANTIVELRSSAVVATRKPFLLGVF